MSNNDGAYYQPTSLSGWNSLVAYGSTKEDTEAYYASTKDLNKTADAFGEQPDWADHVMWRPK